MPEGEHVYGGQQGIALKAEWPRQESQQVRPQSTGLPEVLDSQYEAEYPAAEPRELT